MLLGMMNWQKRVLPFTVLVALLFIIGRASAQTGDVDTTAEGTQPTQQPSSSAPASAPVIDDQTYYVDTDPSAVTLWRPELEPYGVWVEDPVYGLVWIPDAAQVGPDFVPYVTAGHWGYTEAGEWIWVSDYEWGWVAFHYGRWVWIPQRGWAWIPGRLYAPAWVVWRVGDPGYDYVGWAPMPPSYYWYGGVAVAFWVVPPPYYVYCESRYVFGHHVHRHVLHGERARAAGRYTKPYVPARPGSSAGRHAAKPGRGPTLQEANVPPEAVPRTPAKPNPRAVAAAKPAGGSAVQPSSRPLRPVAKRPPVAGVSKPVYRGRPSRTLPVSRRAAPLATRPDLRRESRTGSPNWSTRTLGRTTAPPRVAPQPGSPAATRPAPASRVAPRPTTRPSVRPTTRPSTRPGARPGYAPYPTTRPTTRPAPRPQTRPSGPPDVRPVRPSRPSYSPRPSPRPSYGSSSRPVYRAPASRPSRPSYGSGDNNDNNSRKSRGRSKGRGRRR